jgi:hypothetical protein
MIKSSLLHEAVHASAHHMDWRTKEATIVKIEKLIFALIRDNPEFTKWIMENK